MPVPDLSLLLRKLAYAVKQYFKSDAYGGFSSCNAFASTSLLTRNA
jgi:hypothetical protein